MNLPDHCIDYRGRRIEFPPSAVRHILRNHSEINPYLTRICEALAEPHLVFSRPRRKTHIYYKLGVCDDDYTGPYFVVYVRYNGDRTIVTAHSIRYLPAEVLHNLPTQN